MKKGKEGDRSKKMIQSGRSNSSVRAAAGLLALEFWLTLGEPPPCIFVEWGRVDIAIRSAVSITGSQALGLGINVSEALPRLRKSRQSLAYLRYQAEPGNE